MEKSLTRSENVHVLKFVKICYANVTLLTDRILFFLTFLGQTAYATYQLVSFMLD